MSPSEREGLVSLREQALAKDWVKASDFPNPENKKKASKIVLAASLAKVKKPLVKALKPGRAIVSAVKFSNGLMEEVHDVEKTVTAMAADKGSRAVDVAKPTQGCPEPDFVRAELKARDVLEAFLEPQQLADFRERNRYVVHGAATGHRYMVTSRFAKDELSKYRRQVYDLDERRPYCIHDYTVPGAEEMLAITLMLQMRRHERYIRHLN